MNHEDVLAKTVGDRDWRLRNLYWILDKNGKKIRFEPNEAQLHLLENFWYLNLILKARQRGFTTLVCILWLDVCLFNSNIRAGIVADNRENVGKIFRDKIKFAYENLPDSIKQARPTIKDDANELIFSNNSGVQVGTSMRGGTLQYLHVSEFGKICRHYPDKAQEVVTGSLQSVQAGQFVVIESTAEGRGGHYHDMCMTAQQDKQAGKKLNAMEYKFHFYSWWDADEYEIDPFGITITDEDHEYFDAVEAVIMRGISMRKRAWYVMKRKTLRDKMKQEFPSTPDEAFEQSIDGAYYAKEMQMARAQGRITAVPVLPGVPVHTFWDLGRNDMNAIWFMQEVGAQYRFVRYYENSGEGLAHYAKYVRDTGYLLGSVYVPHDAGHELLGQEETVERQLANMLPGVTTQIVPRVRHITDGINMVRDIFPVCWFDETHCAKGIVHLDNYRKQWNEKLGTWRDEPLHDISSNGADAFRQCAQGYRVTQAATHEITRRGNNWR